MPADAIVRELAEEAGLAVTDLAELFQITDERGSGQRLTVFAAYWDDDPAGLHLNEGTELSFVSPAELGDLTIPPFMRGVSRQGRLGLTTRPSGIAGTTGVALALSTLPARAI